MEKIKSLELQQEKQKIIANSAKNDLDRRNKEVNSFIGTSKEESTRIRQECDKRLSLMNQEMSKLQETVLEYQQKCGQKDSRIHELTETLDQKSFSATHLE